MNVFPTTDLPEEDQSIKSQLPQEEGITENTEGQEQDGETVQESETVKSHMIQKRWFRRMKAKAVTVWTFRLNCLEVRKTLMELEVHRLGQLLKIQEKP